MFEQFFSIFSSRPPIFFGSCAPDSRADVSTESLRRRRQRRRRCRHTFCRGDSIGKTGMESQEGSASHGRKSFGRLTFRRLTFCRMTFLLPTFYRHAENQHLNQLLKMGSYLCRLNIVSVKCCVGQMFCQLNVLSAKCCVDQMSFNQKTLNQLEKHKGTKKRALQLHSA